jgi:Zn-dependent metalloprotease
MTSNRSIFRVGIGGLALGLCITLWGGIALAQPVDRTQAINEARAKNPDLKIVINPRTGMPRSVSGLRRPPPSLGSSASDPSEASIKQAVDAWFATGELSSVYAPHHPQARYQTQNVRRDPDLPGQFVAHVEQRVNDIPVFGSSAKVTVDRSLAVTTPPVTDSISAVNIDDLTPTVTQGQAIDAARAYLLNFAKTRPSVGQPGPPMPDVTKASASAQLNIYDPALSSIRVTGPTRIAWLVSIDTYRVFVDAKTGAVFHFFRDQPSVLVRRVFDLAQSMAFPGQELIDDQTNIQLTAANVDASLAYANTGLVYNFYFLVFGRDSYDDNGRTTTKPGGPIESYVRVGSIQNAYWCPEASSYCPKADVMVFGPDYAGAIDVVGHEMTHGVITYEADLVYSDEAGAVNESLADIFGTLIEFNVKGANGNWLIGEALPGFSMTSPLRNMADPNMVDANKHSHFDKTQDYSATNNGQPASYDQLVQPSDPICATTTDAENGCVHINSGILNKFAYLVSEGGQGVSGLGHDKLARIAYRALTTKLNKSTGLQDAATAFVMACTDLASAHVANITADDCKQVTAAQQAVGLAVTN